MTLGPSAIPNPLPTASSTPPDERPSLVRIALVGNPNTGKTTLFNRLTGLRHKTSNFPGTTLESRIGRFVHDRAGTINVDLIDLPGVYSLELRQAEAEICRDVLSGRAAPAGHEPAEPDGVLVVLDATNLGRNLMLAGEALRRRLPTVVALNMVDLAHKQGLHVDASKLSEALGCTVVPISARSGEGVEELKAVIAGCMHAGTVPTCTPPGDEAALREWAERAFVSAASGTEALLGRTFSDRADLVLTHPLLGVLAFAAIMAGLFFTIFSLAQFPMEWIEGLFSLLRSGVEWALPDGFVRDLLKDGVVAGVGSTLVFVPQICLLFFLISLLEDTGYLARAAFVMDRALRPFGLPGHAFVPFLSSHACALPGIMAARCIPDRRERLATMLVAPFMTCSARLPVYVLLTGLLFKDQPWAAALAFIGCYALGMSAGVLSALIVRRTVLRGAARPMALELPGYKLPSLRNAMLGTMDRGVMFLRKAGTNILAICVILWWMGSFPRVEPPARLTELRQQTEVLNENDPKVIAAREEKRELELSHARNASANSFMGLVGKSVQPVFEPLGFDWQLTIGVMASFAAREVFVSTMTVVITGEEVDAADAASDLSLRERLGSAVRQDGVTPVFTKPAAWSLLVFFVLAMQCLPTLVVTARESGHVKWALLQLVWMSAVAYSAAWIAYRIAVAAA